MAAVEGDKLLGRGTEISEQSAQCRSALDTELRAEHSAVIERHGLCRERAALHEVHQHIAGLEKCSRYQVPTALRIPLVASSQTI